MVDDTNFSVIGNAAIKVLIEPAVTSSLGPLGFDCVDGLKWVRSDDAPIRQIFTFHKWKGGSFDPSWGVSLDFVPHIAAKRLRWHRTPKSAMQDMRVDTRHPGLSMSYLDGGKDIAGRIHAVMQRALPEARAFWDRARTIEDLPAAFDWLKHYYQRDPRNLDPYNREFYMYTQHPAALAFVLARLGRTAEATDEIAKYHGFACEPVRERLMQLLRSDPQSVQD